MWKKGILKPLVSLGIVRRAVVQGSSLGVRKASLPLTFCADLWQPAQTPELSVGLGAKWQIWSHILAQLMSYLRFVVKLSSYLGPSICIKHHVLAKISSSYALITASMCSLS